MSNKENEKKTNGTIKRYCKGNITSTAKTYTLYAKNHTTEAGENININVKKCTTYGTPKEAPKRKTRDVAPEGSINLYAGVFFDGTGNNMYNSDELYYKKLKNGCLQSIPDEIEKQVQVQEGKKTVTKTIKITNRDSYWNPYSNVAKLYQLYESKTSPIKTPELGEYLMVKQYVEGIGTKEKDEDDILGTGMARGSWGILARVEEAIQKLVKEQVIPAMEGTPKKVNKIILDVFGFSRGAAAARHFCNEVKQKGKYAKEGSTTEYPVDGKKYLKYHAGGYLGEMLYKAKLQPTGITYNIEIRFLGLFDTVVSDFIKKTI